MSEHKYILEPYNGMNTRYRCPTCQQRDKTFSLYIDTETGEHINPTVGRCNRESNCGHHYTPKQYFQDNNISFGVWQWKQVTTGFLCASVTKNERSAKENMTAKESFHLFMLTLLACWNNRENTIPTPPHKVGPDQLDQNRPGANFQGGGAT